MMKLFRYKQLFIAFLTGILVLTFSMTKAECMNKAFFASEEADASVHDVVDWVVKNGDYQGRPFVVVDK